MVGLVLAGIVRLLMTLYLQRDEAREALRKAIEERDDERQAVEGLVRERDQAIAERDKARQERDSAKRPAIGQYVESQTIQVDERGAQLISRVLEQQIRAGEEEPSGPPGPQDAPHTGDGSPADAQ